MGKQQKFRLRGGLIATSMAIVRSGAQAGDYANVYFFGDSLSDNGAYAPVVGPNARFTTNPGSVWTDTLGASYGKSVSPAYTAFQSGGPGGP
jgi:outer membrane lipase/esterase